MEYNKSMKDHHTRPDPDALLALINEEEAGSKRGKLKIFLGYVAGVGKTYAMLEAAHQRLAEGIDVVIGYAETHKRKETEALLPGLEVLPRSQVTYRGAVLSEMDIDAVIARRPQLVLIDELAHTNAPGSRHTKRYQDVDEILDAGIDVYSTVNIQHLESLSDIVQQITGVTVQEKIPDRLVDEADEIELIDLPTDELLKRLRDGKVYVSEQAMRALEKFFRKGNLTALRELSLRRAASQVDNQMLTYMQKEEIPGPWPAGDRILVCISSHPLGERLIRSGCRLANELQAEWHVLFVETPQHLHMPLENRLRVQQLLNLAEELGAKTSSITGESVAGSVIAYAREHNVTKIIAGKPTRPHLWELIRGSVIDKIIAASGNIDVYIVSSELSASKNVSHPALMFSLVPWRYIGSLLLIGIVTLLNRPLNQALEPTNLVMIYLLGVVIAAVYLGRGPAILASVLSVLSFDFFYIEPLFNFAISDTQYVLTFIGLLVVSLIISSSAPILRDQIDAMRRKDRQTQALFNLSRELTAAVSLPQVLDISLRTITLLLQCEGLFLLPHGSSLKIAKASPQLILEENDLAVAEWAYKHSRPSGNGTDTLSASTFRFMPLTTAKGSVGIFGIKINTNQKILVSDQRFILEGLVNLTALAVERASLAESAAHHEMLQQTEKLQTALLNSISHELRTPLASIIGVLTSLSESEKNGPAASKFDVHTRFELIESATDQARQLNRLVENLLSMTRIDAGSVRLNIEPCDLQDLVGAVIRQLSLRLKNRPLMLQIPDGLPLVMCDAVLIAQVITNILDNTCKYTPNDTPISLGMINQGNNIEIFVKDHGVSLQPDELTHVFDKFYRGSGQKNKTGTGLGLSICKGIIEAHQGWIKAETNPDGGMIIRFSLPVNPPSQVNP